MAGSGYYKLLSACINQETFVRGGCTAIGISLAFQPEKESRRGHCSTAGEKELQLPVVSHCVVKLGQIRGNILPRHPRIARRCSPASTSGKETASFHRKKGIDDDEHGYGESAPWPFRLLENRAAVTPARISLYISG